MVMAPKEGASSAGGAQALPIRLHAPEIMQAIKEHPTVVVIGETGSGKTTQISQMLLKAGYAESGMIAVTQPRRVAAVTVARRVAEEVGCELGTEVGYAVRFEDCTCPDTKIKYLTDGTLLRECLEDAKLLKYSVIVLDEAHERGLNTDILFGVLKKLVRTRATPLKLVITSATLDGEKFSSYFNDCPVFNVPGRCFPVDIVFSMEDHTQNYVTAAVDTVLQIHTQHSLTQGDILVFLTGQAEIEKAIRLLNEAVGSLPEGECEPLLLLPLYASLPPELQVRVFRPAPGGTRRCIISTNVAETSVTVEGVVYVVDSGMVKQKNYQPSTGMDSLDVVCTSRVGATQRAGRAGRTRPGKCFRLYSKVFYDRTMPDVTAPEIQRTSLAGAVLHLKSLALEIDVLTFDFLDSPSRESLEDALRTLHLLDALDAEGHVTAVGRTMANLPLEPGLARCLLAALELRCLPDVISIAAMLSSERVFEHGRAPGDDHMPGRPEAPQGGRGVQPGGPSQPLKALVAEGLGDHLLMMRLWDAYSASGFSRDVAKELGLDMRGLAFARDVRRQLEGVMSGHSGPATAPAAAHEATKPDSKQPSTGRLSDARDRSRSRERDRHREQGRHNDRQPEQGRHRDREHERGSDRDRSIGRNGDRGIGRDSDRGQDAGRDEPQDRHRGAGQPASQQAAPGRGQKFQSSLRPHEWPSDLHRVAAVTKALTIGFAHKLAKRLPNHNGYRTLGTGATVGGGQLAQIHPGSSGLKEDADGLLPEWVVYHELVSTSRPFLRQVCATDYGFVKPLLAKIARIDIHRLSGSKGPVGPKQGGAAAPATELVAPVSKRNDSSAVNAARERFLARKAGHA